MISVAELPTDHVNEGIKFNGARAVTSESGKGAILQHNQRLYELTCENSGCSWRILPQELSPGVLNAVMMTLPSDYTTSTICAPLKPALDYKPLFNSNRT